MKDKNPKAETTVIDSLRDITGKLGNESWEIFKCMRLAVKGQVPEAESAAKDGVMFRGTVTEDVGCFQREITNLNRVLDTLRLVHDLVEELVSEVE